MLLPFVTAPHEGAMQMPMPDPEASGGWYGAQIIAVHTLGYLIVLSAIALLVYKWLGLSLLRTAWFNVDLFWAMALILTGVISLFT